MARQFVLLDETYISHPLNDTLRVFIDNNTAQGPDRYNITIEFTSAYMGYGRRDGGLATIQPHKGYVTVSKNRVVEAQLDDYWDMIKEEKVSGKTYPQIPGLYILDAAFKINNSSAEKSIC